MSDEAWDDPQVSLMACAAGYSQVPLMACAADPETAASRDIPSFIEWSTPLAPTKSASSARASGDAGASSDTFRVTFARRGSRPGPARVPSNQRAVRELEQLLRGLSSSWPTLSQHGLSDVASQGAVEGKWDEDFQCSPTDLNAARNMFRPAPGDLQPLVTVGRCEQHPWSIQGQKYDVRDV